LVYFAIDIVMELKAECPGVFRWVGRRFHCIAMRGIVWQFNVKEITI